MAVGSTELKHLPASADPREPFGADKSAPSGTFSPTVSIIAGIGFRRAAEAGEIAVLIQRALALSATPEPSLAAIATAADRADEAAAVAAAAAFGLTPTGIAADALRAADLRVTTRSARIEAARGVGSVAEAAALALAGEGGRLILPRIASAGATCALALAPDFP